MPPSPIGELARSLREIANHEIEAGIKFTIIETGSKTIERQIQLSNPTATTGCDRHDCLPCQTGRGTSGICSKSNIVYVMECQLWPDDSKCVYLGKSSKNLYSRTKEHPSNYSNRKPTSFILKHQRKNHNGQPGNFNAKVIDSYNDCLSNIELKKRMASATTLEGPGWPDERMNVYTPDVKFTLELERCLCANFGVIFCRNC